MKSLIHKLKVKISDSRLRYQLGLDVKRGYILEDGTPLKCYKCKSTNLEEYGHYYEEHLCIEHGVRCKDCGANVGYWSYGYWEV